MNDFSERISKMTSLEEIQNIHSLWDSTKKYGKTNLNFHFNLQHKEIPFSDNILRFETKD